jgi:hypothetical protein
MRLRQEIQEMLRAQLSATAALTGGLPRYDKLLVNFMGFVKLAAIAIWLK